MTLQERVRKGEKERLIFMSFQADKEGLWGLPEGDSALHHLNQEQIKDYVCFLQDCIAYYEALLSFFNNDWILNKSKEKYELYLKRLEISLSKL